MNFDNSLRSSISSPSCFGESLRPASLVLDFLLLFLHEAVGNLSASRPRVMSLHHNLNPKPQALNLKPQTLKKPKPQSLQEFRRARCPKEAALHRARFEAPDRNPQIPNVGGSGFRVHGLGLRGLRSTIQGFGVISGLRRFTVLCLQAHQPESKPLFT